VFLKENTLTSAQDQARKQIHQLVAKYRAMSDAQKREITEANVVHQFLDPLFEALGWPVRDPARYKYEPTTQAGRPDMVLIPEQGGTIFVEAKRFGTIKELEQARRTIAGIVTPGQLALPGMAAERAQEMQRLLAQGEPVPEEVVARMAQHTEQVMVQIAQARPEEAPALLEQVMERTRVQQHVLQQVRAAAPEEAQTALRRALEVTERAYQTASVGLEDPERFQNEYQYQYHLTPGPHGQATPSVAPTGLCETCTPQQDRDRDRDRDQDRTSAPTGTPEPCQTCTPEQEQERERERERGQDQTCTPEATHTPEQEREREREQERNQTQAPEPTVTAQPTDTPEPTPTPRRTHTPQPGPTHSPMPTHTPGEGKGPGGG